MGDAERLPLGEATRSAEGNPSAPAEPGGQALVGSNLQPRRGCLAATAIAHVDALQVVAKQALEIPIEPLQVARKLFGERASPQRDPSAEIHVSCTRSSPSSAAIRRASAASHAAWASKGSGSWLNPAHMT